MKELIARLQASFSTLSQREKRLVSIAGGAIAAFLLFVVIHSFSAKADVTLEGDKIVESAVELSLTDVKLNRLLDFLTAVESAPGGLVKVKYLRMEPRPAQETLSAWLTIATYHAK